MKVRLTKDQIKRLYDEFDFDDSETILDAWLNTHNNTLDIGYEDGDEIYCVYKTWAIEPERIDYIMDGKKY